MRRAYAAAAALALTALTACTDGGGNAGPTSRPTVTEPVPMIATDPCPKPGDLLPGEPSGGRRLPDVDRKCLGHDGTVNMRALGGGRPYVVNLWASWCAPCKSEMPEFQKVYTDLKDRVGFLGVNTKDFDKNARSVIQATAISYPSVVDFEEEVRRFANARALPATIFVGPDGVVREVHVGEMTEAELRAAIAEHLGITS